ncbi:MAG: response regulator transcription factor, partial [Chloroflexota bacterium]
MVSATGLIDSPQTKIERSHILVVDDEIDIAESLEEFLTAKGHVVSILDSGKDALRYLVQASLGNFPDRGAVDLILLDMMMPEVSGNQVLEGLRNHPDHNLRYTRVIMLTASFKQNDKVEALEAGADDYITKPYHPQELLARVHTLLRTQQLEKQLQAQREQLAVLNQVEQELSVTLDMRAAYQKAAKGLRRILNVEVAAVFVKITEAHEIRSLSIDCDHADIEHPPIPLGQ